MLHKHANQRKTNRPMKGVKKGEWYISNDCKHNKNQVAYAYEGKDSILQEVFNGLVGEKHRKLVQFVTLFHTFKHGRPMFEYEVHKDLFEFLNFKENPKMHWIDISGWAMTQHMHGSHKICCLSSLVFIIYL